MIFSRLQLQNWRNFTQVDTEPSRRVFLVGPGASGMSNLLDTLWFLRDIADPEKGVLPVSGQQEGQA